MSISIRYEGGVCIPFCGNIPLLEHSFGFLLFVCISRKAWNFSIKF